MNRIVQILACVLIGLSILACNLTNLLSSNGNLIPASPTQEIVQPSLTLAVTTKSTQELLAPSPTVDESQPAANLEPCSLVTTAEVEAILAEPASPPNPVSGGCTFTNAKDSLYAVSVGAGQDQQAIGLMQGQAVLLGFAGAPLDADRMAKLKQLADGLDYKGFFGELVVAAKGSSIIKAQISEGGGNDLVYWAWITAQTRRQGALVVVRGPTMVNINLLVANTRTEESMLAASKALAEEVFKRLPPKFSLSGPAATPTSVPTQVQDLKATPTLVK
jgi:hypothetical protein